jgi:hypothetical protein
MNENDLRDALAILATCGFIMRNEGWDPADPWRVADDVIAARNKEPEQEVGIVAVKSRRKKND